MIHPTPTKTLLTTTFEPLVMQLSGLLARGTRLLDRFVHAEPTPATTMALWGLTSPGRCCGVEASQPLSCCVGSCASSRGL